MTGKEKLRETMNALPTLEHISERLAAGWRLAAIEWERDISAAGEPPQRLAQEIPYGLRIADDCSGLVESAEEREVVICALDMIVDDCPLSQVAEELNRRGYRARTGAEWTSTTLFVLLPRMIEIGPRLFSSTDWASRKQRLKRVV